MEKVKDNVCVTSSNYSLFLYLIIKNIPIKESFFIFDKGININLENLNYIFPKEKKYNNHLMKILGKYWENQKARLYFKKIGLENAIIYGSDHIIYNRYFKKYHDIFLIEDGTANYIMDNNNNNKSLSKKIRERILWMSPSWGLSPRVKKIYLTGLGEIPHSIKDKVEIINIKDYWEKCDIKEEIKKLFYLDKKEEDLLKNKKEILLTQPLSEDGLLLEEEKIELYRKILKNYKKENIIIKKHPREKTDYQKYFPDYNILDTSAPLQLLELLEIKINRLITIFSTGIFTSNKEIIIDFYGTEVHEKLYKIYGSLDNIYKRNKYL